ncbi:MAG: hypothetical protein JNL70_01770 [Saprospiraceae bacterium]|nr:hypothetical protein [Saprospiraceae bacterium]
MSFYTEGGISDVDFKKFQAQTLQQRRLIEATEATFIQNDMQIRQIENPINGFSQSQNGNEER